MQHNSGMTQEEEIWNSWDKMSCPFQKHDQVAIQNATFLTAINYLWYVEASRWIENSEIIMQKYPEKLIPENKIK